MMQKDKKLVIVFLVILFGICLCIPCKFVLVKIGVMSMNMDNFLEYKEKDVNNVVDKINNVVGRIENSVENKVTNYFPFYNVINSLYDKVDFTIILDDGKDFGIYLDNREDLSLIHI